MTRFLSPNLTLKYRLTRISCTSGYLYKILSHNHKNILIKLHEVPLKGAGPLTLDEVNSRKIRPCLRPIYDLSLTAGGVVTLYAI